MSDPALGLIGLCARAGKLVSGEQACDQQVKRGAAKLVLVDQGASPLTRKAFQDACAYYKVPLRLVPEGALGAAIGRPGRKAAAITDQALANRISQLLTDTQH